MIDESARRTLAAAVLLLAPILATGATHRIAVLTPSASWSGRCDAASRERDAKQEERCSVLDAIADEARSGAVSALRGLPWIVMTRENTALLLEEMGSDACSEGECEVETAKLIGADHVVSGAVALIEGTWHLTFKLHEVATARLLGTSRLKGATQSELIDRARPGAEEMLRKGLGLGGGPSVSAAPPPTSPPASSVATPGATCPQGQADAGGHCCWPGQDWGTSAGRCVGTPACPDGFLSSGEGCVAGCGGGRQLVAGHCCWPGQDWGARERKCVGEPACPSDWTPIDGGCVEVPKGTVLLPGGTFTMALRGDRVTVARFFLDVTEVTVSAYEQCAKAGRCNTAGLAPWLGGKWCNWGKAGKETHPLNCVDWNQAQAFCAWAGKRLPTEEEWEWAARGAERGTTFPWGEDAPGKDLCFDRQGLWQWSQLGTCPAGSSAGDASPQGIRDLAGSVSEWTSSRQDAKQRAFRGGDWRSSGAGGAAAANGFRCEPSVRNDELGFRCAKSP